MVNITDENIIEENSETPSNDGRGEFPIGEDWLPIKAYSNGAIQNNPLQSLDKAQLHRLQEATLSVKGQWYNEDKVNGTSAAAATLSGFLVLLRQKFPNLPKSHLREAVLYSAVKEFDVPQEAYQPDMKHKFFRKGTLKEKKVNINNAWYRNDNHASPSFYGQGLFDAKRALKYAEELSKLSTKEPYKSWFYQLHPPK